MYALVYGYCEIYAWTPGPGACGLVSLTTIPYPENTNPLSKKGDCHGVVASDTGWTG